MNFFNTFINKQLSRLSPTKKKVFANISWALGGKMINILSTLIVGIFVARYLGPERFGILSYVMSYVTLFTIAASFGTPQILIRELSKGDRDPDIILGSTFTVRITMAIVTIILIIITVILFEDDTFTQWAIISFSIVLIVQATDIIKDFFISELKNEYIIKSEIIRTIISATIKLLLLYFKASLLSFIIVNILDYFIIAISQFFFYKKYYSRKITWKFDKKEARYLLKESVPLLLSGVAIIIYQKIGQIMVRNMIDNSALGQYSIAIKYVSFLMFFPILISNTVTPLLVKEKTVSEEKYNFRIQQFSDTLFWGTIILSGIISLVSVFVIRLLYGLEYAEAGIILRILIWSPAITSLSISSGQWIIINGLQKYAVIRNILGAVSNVILNLYLIPKFGVMGAVYATLLSYSIAAYFAHFFIKAYWPLIPIQSKTLFLAPFRYLSLMFKKINLSYAKNI